MVPFFLVGMFLLGFVVGGGITLLRIGKDGGVLRVDTTGEKTTYKFELNDLNDLEKSHYILLTVIRNKHSHEKVTT